MQTAWAEGRVKDAMAIQNRLVPLHDALFSETSPGPVKYRRLAAGQDLRTLPPAAGAADGADTGDG